MLVDMGTKLSELLPALMKSHLPVWRLIFPSLHSILVGLTPTSQRTHDQTWPIRAQAPSGHTHCFRNRSHDPSPANESLPWVLC